MQVQAIYRSAGSMGIIIDTTVEQTEVPKKEPIFPDRFVKHVLFRGQLMTEQEAREWDDR